MKKKALRDLLDRVEAWPEEAQVAAFDSLSAIEEKWYEDPTIIDDIIQSREDIEQGRLTSEGDLVKELHLFSK